MDCASILSAWAAILDPRGREGYSIQTVCRPGMAQRLASFTDLLAPGAREELRTQSQVRPICIPEAREIAGKQTLHRMGMFGKRKHALMYMGREERARTREG